MKGVKFNTIREFTDGKSKRLPPKDDVNKQSGSILRHLFFSKLQ